MKRFLIYLISLYQKYISPIKKPCCRFYPTCSSYAIEAISKKGVIKGVILSIWRILRCNPFSKGGFDPVDKTDVSDNH
ncbi:MAG: membrane protein insertion efficiency factor YidD [Clostridia bacterium]|nr:membrane protein insertion efficiency factor YidD [Clostridia bacterium]